MMSDKFWFAIDGMVTFTDVFCLCPGGTLFWNGRGSGFLPTQRSSSSVIRDEIIQDLSQVT